MIIKNKQKPYDVCIVGGAGHVGAPLSIVLANHGFNTLIFDHNEKTMDLLAAGTMPFMEEGGEPQLARALEEGNLGFTKEAEDITNVPIIIVTIGTPIDEFHNPNFSVMTRCIEELLPYLDESQTLILRSTVAPGTTAYLEQYLEKKGKKMNIAFCPERVVQGRAIEEIQQLSQIISGNSDVALNVANTLFSTVSPEVVEMSSLEAEYAKLICNAYRYIQFAATNQLYMLVESAGIDYGRLLKKMKQGYPRMEGIPGAGFAAGPCLMKDTMQLYAFGKKNFALGQMAMMANEGLPNFIADMLGTAYDLKLKKVAVLGMAFKGNSDDIRDSLSFKLVKVLTFQGAEVICSDPLVDGFQDISPEGAISLADIIIIGAPHSCFKNLEIPGDKHLVDIWGMFSKSI